MNKKVVIGGCILGGTLLACYLYHQQQKKRRIEIEKLLSELKEAKAVDKAKLTKSMPAKAVVSQHQLDQEDLTPPVSMTEVNDTAATVAATPMAHVSELDVSNKDDEANEGVAEVVEEKKIIPTPKASTSKLIKHSFSNEEIEAMMQAKRRKKEEEQKRATETKVVAEKDEEIIDSDAFEDKEKESEKDVTGIDVKRGTPPVAAKVEKRNDDTEKGSIALSKNNDAVTDGFPLRLGSRGKYVERLQVWLLRNYGLVAKVSKVFDESTLAQVKKHLKTELVSEALFNKYKMGNHVHQQLMVR